MSYRVHVPYMYCVDLHVPVLYMYVYTVDLVVDLLGSVHPGRDRLGRQFIGKAESIPIPARVDIPLDPGVPELALQVHDHLPVGT